MQKVAVITGGSSGIGRALVFEYAQKGYAVVFTGRNERRMQETEEKLDEAGHEYLALSLDSAIEEHNKELINKTIRSYGRIDVLICNAGVSMRTLFEDIELDIFKQLMDINFYGTIYAVKYALTHILASKGSIVGISSINGRRSTPARSAYTASKFAMEGFFEALRTEIMTRGVHVLVVCPGFTASNIRNASLTAEGKAQGRSPREEHKMMSAQEVAKRTYKAQQKRKRDLVLTFQGKMAVFLNKVIPSKLDKIVYNVVKKERDNPLK